MNKPLISLLSLLAVTALSVGAIAPALADEPSTVTDAPAAATATVVTPAPAVTPTPVTVAHVKPAALVTVAGSSSVASAQKARAARLVAARAAARKAAAKKAAAKRAAAKKAATKKAAKPSSASELKTAQGILASLQAKYKYLDGVTVSIGTTPGGYQAVNYYTAGRILISSKHTVSLSRILNHEIWHTIDWRDNGKIDWGESVAPKNASSYLK
jgi:hypothetical protein